MHNDEFEALRARYAGNVGAGAAVGEQQTSTGLSKGTKGALWILGAFVLATGAVVYYNRKDAESDDAGGMEPAANPIDEGPSYTLDGDPVDIDDFIEANPDLDDEDVEEIQALEVGEVFTGGGGAWATYVIERTA
jgi:hypothetical protein